MIEALITLVIAGVVLYLVENYIPMSPPIKTVIRVIVVIALCLFVLDFFGLYDAGRLRR